MKPRKKLSQRAGSALMIFVPVFGVLLATSLPDSWSIQLSGTVGAFISFLYAIIPSIRQFSQVSAFPAVTQAFLAIMWTCVPFITAFALNVEGFFRFDEPDAAKKRWPALLSLLAFLFFTVYLPLTFTISPEDLIGGTFSPNILRQVSNSRIWMGVIGSLACMTSAMVIGAAISFVRNFRRLFLERKYT